MKRNIVLPVQRFAIGSTEYFSTNQNAGTKNFLFADRLNKIGQNRSYPSSMSLSLSIKNRIGS